MFEVPKFVEISLISGITVAQLEWRNAPNRKKAFDVQARSRDLVSTKIIIWKIQQNLSFCKALITCLSNLGLGFASNILTQILILSYM